MSGRRRGESGARVRPYWVLLSARYRMLLQYRAAAVAGAGTQFFWGFILIMVLDAFSRSSSQEPPLPFTAAVSYIWLGQALFSTLPWNHDRELEAMVREGTVAYELVRPVDLYGFWYARTLAMRLAPGSLRALPIVIIAGFAVIDQRCHEFSRNRRILELIAARSTGHIKTVDA